MKCKFCEGKGESIYFDMQVCIKKNCIKEGEKCDKGYNCKDATGINLCPDCNGTGIEKIDKSKN